MLCQTQQMALLPLYSVMDVKWNVPAPLMAVKHAFTLRVCCECKLCKQQQKVPMCVQGNTQGWVALLWQKLRELPAEPPWWTAAMGMKPIPGCCPTKVGPGWLESAQGGKRNILCPQLVESGCQGRRERRTSSSFSCDLPGECLAVPTSV